MDWVHAHTQTHIQNRGKTRPQRKGTNGRHGWLPRHVAGYVSFFVFPSTSNPEPKKEEEINQTTRKEDARQEIRGGERKKKIIDSRVCLFFLKKGHKRDKESKKVAEGLSWVLTHFFSWMWTHSCDYKAQTSPNTHTNTHTNREKVK